MKKLFRNKILLIGLALVVLVGVCFYTISAFFVDKDIKQAVFCASGVEIDLTQTNYPGDNSKTVMNMTALTEVPKNPVIKNVSKAPTLVYMAVSIPYDTVALSSYDDNIPSYASLTQLFTYGYDNVDGVRNSWTLVKDGYFGQKKIVPVDNVLRNTSERFGAIDTDNKTVTYVYAYSGDTVGGLKTLDFKAQTEALFDYIKLGDIESKYIDEAEKIVVVSAYGIQEEGLKTSNDYENITEVWNVLNTLTPAADSTSDENVITDEIVRKLIDGPSFNRLVKILGSDFTSVHIGGYDIPGDANTVDVSNRQNGSIYAWRVNDEVFISSTDGAAIEANEDCSYMFDGMSSLTSIIFDEISTSAVVDMTNMFSGLKNIEYIDLSKFNTANVLTMANMFSGDEKLLTIAAEDLEMHNVTNISGMFKDCANLNNVNLSSWDLTNCVNAGDLFNGCGSLSSVDLSSFQNNSITNMSYMFAGTAIESIDINNINTSQVMNFGGMFMDCEKLTVINNINSMNVENGTNFNSMFRGMINIEELFLSNWNTQNMISAEYMFEGCSKLGELNVSSFDITKLQYCDYMFANGGFMNIYGSGWSKLKTLDAPHMFANSPDLPDYDSSVIDWSMADVGKYFALPPNTLLTGVKFNAAIPDEATYVEFLQTDIPTNVSTVDVSAAQNWSVRGWLGNGIYDTDEDINTPELGERSGFIKRTSKNNLPGVFYVASVDGDIMRTHPICNGMFQDKNNIKRIDFGKNGVLTSELTTSTKAMFNNCSSLTGINLCNITCIEALNENYDVFSGCVNLRVAYYGSRDEIRWLVKGGGNSVDTKPLQVYSDNECGTTMAGFELNAYIPAEASVIKFENKPVPEDKEIINLSMGLDYSVVGWMEGNKFIISSSEQEKDAIFSTDMRRAFYSNDNITAVIIDDVNTSKLENMGYMFYGSKNLQYIALYGFDVSSVNNVECAFTANAVKNIYVDNDITFNKDCYLGPTHMGSSLGICQNTSIVGTTGLLPDGYLSALKNEETLVNFLHYDMLGTKLTGGDYEIVSGYGINLSDSIKNVRVGDYHTLIPETAEDLSIKKNGKVLGWADGDTYYISSVDGREIIASSTCQSMFRTQYLTSVVLENFNTSNTINFSSMFSNFDSTVGTTQYPKSVLSDIQIDTLDTSSGIYMQNMFRGAPITSINVSSFNTEKAENILGMFYGTKITQLDISGFDTRNVKNCGSFIGYYSTTVYASDKLIFPLTTNQSVKETVGQDYNGNIVDVYGKVTGTNHVVHSSNIQDYIILANNDRNTLCAGTTFQSLLTDKISNGSLRVENIFIGDYSDSIPSDSSQITDFSTRSDGSVIGWKDGTNYYITSTDGNPIVASGSLTNMFQTTNYTTYIKTITIDNLNLDNVVSMKNMFNGQRSLTSVSVNEANVPNLKNFSYTFNNCTSLVTLNLAGLQQMRANTYSYAFNNCTALKTLLLPDGIVTSDTTDLSYMFYSCNALEAINVTDWDTSSVKNFSYAFYGCKTITDLDVSNWDTSSATSMNSIFSGCFQLNELDVTDWDVSNVENFYYAFSDCRSIKSFDLRKWDLQRCTSCGYMFYMTGNAQLETIYSNKDWQTEYPKLTTNNIYNYMFGQSSSSYSYPLAGAIKYNYSYTGLNYANPVTGYFTFCLGEQNALLPGAKINALIPSNATSVVFTNSVAEGFTYTDLSESGDGSILGWLDGTVFNIAAVDGGNTIMHPISNGIFKSKTSLTGVDFSCVDTSYVLYINEMFYGCTKITNFTSTLNFENAKSARALFYGCSNLTIWDPSEINLTSCEDMAYMFYQCTKLTTVDLSGCNSHKVANMSYMFYFDNVLKSVDMSGVYADALTSASNMFYACYQIKLMDLRHWHMSSTTNVSKMFYSCNQLVTVYANNWAETYNAFEGCGNLVGDYGSYANGDEIYNENLITRQEYAVETNMLKIGGLVNSAIPSSATGVVFTDTVQSGNSTTDLSALGDGSVVGWLSGGTYYIASVNGEKILANPNSASMFSGKASITSIDFSNLDTSRVYNFKEMIYGCRALTSINTELLDVSNAGTLNNMFTNCTSLVEIDTTGWNTSKVGTFYGMFFGCTQLQSVIGIEDWDMSSAKTVSQLFMACQALTYMDIRDWNISQLKYASEMFSGCIKLSFLRLDNWTLPDTIKSVKYMFCNDSNLYYIIAKDWTAPSSIISEYMFANCGQYDSLGTNDIKYANTRGAFTDYNTLHDNTIAYGKAFKSMITAPNIVFDKDLTIPEGVILKDVSEKQNGTVVGWIDGDTFYVTTPDNGTIYANTDMGYAFSMSNLVSVNLNGLDWTNTTKAENMFQGSKVTDLGSTVTFPALTTTMNMFRSINSAELSCDIIVPNATDASYMFAYSSFTSFSGSVSLPKATNVSYMFNGLSYLKSINLNNVSCPVATNFTNFLSNNSALKTVNIGSFNTSNATILNYMFYNNYAIETIDIADIDTSKVTSMNSLFYGCSMLETVNLAHVNTSGVTDMQYMFSGCNKLKYIYIDMDNCVWSTAKVSSSYGMFNGCSLLPNYSSSYTDKTRAYADGDGKGYFTSIHNYDEWNYDLEPTCTTEGHASRTCLTCGHVDEKSFAALGHELADGVCNRCGVEITISITPTSNGTYFFEQNGDTWTSNNKSVHSSTASTKLSIENDIALTVSWTVSSESGWDKLTITLDGSTVVSAVSGTNNGTFTIPAGSHTVDLTYAKDGSGNAGNDCGTVTFTY